LFIFNNVQITGNIVQRIAAKVKVLVRWQHFKNVSFN